MSEKTMLTKRTTTELDELFEYVSPRDLSRNLIQVYFLHITQNKGTFPLNFHELTSNMYFLIRFLEVAEDERNGMK